LQRRLQMLESSGSGSRRLLTRGSEGLRRIAQRVASGRSDKKALILLYHRTAKVNSDPWGLSVTPRHFAEHLEVLRQCATPIQLQQLVQTSFDDLPERSVVVTFDDGYADNLYNAKPLLERYAIPATIFLTTGYIGYEREFWWDELDRLLLQPGTLPRALRLSINGSTYQWDLGEAAHYSEDDSQRHRHWKIRKDAPSSRHHLYRSLCELLNPLPEGERQKVLDELLTWAGAQPTSRPTHRPLSLTEVASLAKGELIEVGAHTVTHPALSALPVASQLDEIQGSKTWLEEILDCSVSSFAYPYGGQSDYTEETINIVREAGFASACSNFPGLTKEQTDPLQFPRVNSPNRNGETFTQWLSRWLSD
jgi:peptidoglycan/xylan/chitin deacetylase (PgdA/CDA1 family)